MEAHPQRKSGSITQKPIDCLLSINVKSDKQYKKDEQLQKLLDQYIINLSEETIQSQGHVSESKLAELSRLEHLAHLNKSTLPPRAKKRWPVITLLAVTLIIVSLLLFARVSSTEIELDLSLSEVSFRLPEEQVLTNEIRLSSLGVSGIQEMELPRSATKEAQIIQTLENKGSAIRLTPVINDQQNNSVTLAAIILPARSRINISPGEIPQQYRLSIRSEQMDLRAAVDGIIEMAQAGAPPEQANFLSPKTIVFKSGSEEINLDMNFLTGTKSIFPRQLLADSLSLFNVDEHSNADNTNTIIRHVSTVLSGTLYFESLGGKEKQLRPAQEIRFESSTGEIRTLDFKDDHIALTFHGTVQGMTTGGDKNRVSLMPTYLEWLSARHGLSLLWGTTLYFFGLLVSIAGWWRAKQ
ncbi:MAG: hypothetical protein ABIO55_14840 [Ginsengibacter sp.]